MSPRLKPLLLPQLVQERQKLYQMDDSHQIEPQPQPQPQQHYQSQSQSHSQGQGQSHQTKPALVHNFCYPYPATVPAQSQTTPQPPLQPQSHCQSHSQHKHSDSVNSNTTDPSVGYYTGDSSSDITSPLTPTFSARGGHLRCSSSSSSLDLASTAHTINNSNNCSSSSSSSSNMAVSSFLPPSTVVLAQDNCLPTTSSTKTEFLSLQPTKPAMRSLPDVQEDPLEQEEPELEEEETPVMDDHFGLYSCLCDAPCEHRNSVDSILPSRFDYEIDYDYGFLSDGEYTAERRKKRLTSESPFLALTSRVGSRLGSLHRWKSPRRNNNLMASPTTGVSFEHVLSNGPSSRSSSISSPPQPVYSRSTATTSMSFYDSTESVESSQKIAINPTIDEEEVSPEKDRSMATTPLLPPLMTNPFEKPASEPQSPLQSPTIAPPSLATEIYSPPPTMSYFPRPSLSTRPSMSSLRGGSKNDIPFMFPDLFQEHDSWSDRLGHANFTIHPQPYEPFVTAETLDKFRDDWSLARINYTKHLVRTGENYGTTSKIYGLTEAKWAEVDSRWSSIYEGIRGRAGLESYHHSATSQAGVSISMSRSRSRDPHSRSRSGSLTVASHTHGHSRHPSQDDFASVQWREVERDFSSVVPQMLGAGEAEGKFPERGDEDIVGPMQRDVVMRREGGTDGEVLKGAKFWKNLAGKVGIKTQ